MIEPHHEAPARVPAAGAGGGGLPGLARRLPGAAGGTSGAAEAAQTVSDIVVRRQPWQDRLKACGQVWAVQEVDLSVPVWGIVDKIAFQSC